MLHILFMILKIIGMIIAILLGVLLLGVLIVAFVPLRYRIDGKCEGTLDTLEVQVRFSWLLHLISGFCVYRENAADWQVRLAWKRMNVEEPEGKEETVREEPDGKMAKNTVEDPVREPEESVQKESSPKESKKKQKRRKSIAGKIKGLFQKIKYTFVKICDNIKLLIEKKEKVIEFLNHEIHRNAFTKTRDEGIRLFRFLKPRRLRGRIRYGFEDPYITGKVLAGAGMLYPFYGGMLVIEPDFEEKIFEGEFYIKGCVRGIYAAIVFLNLILNKDMRTTYKHIRAFQL